MMNVYVVVTCVDESVIPYDRKMYCIGFKIQKLLLNFLCEFSV